MDVLLYPNMMYTMGSFLASLALSLMGYCIAEALSTRREVLRYGKHPLVSTGRWLLAPRSLLNFEFFLRGAKLLQKGYETHRSGTFQLVRSQGNMVVLPGLLLEELSALPPTIASPHGALEHDLVGRYTGLNLILESRIHHSIVQRKLTPRLPRLVPALEEELSFAFEEHFPLLPEEGEWIEFQPYQVFAKVSARLTARALVGKAFCRDPTWLNVAFEYTENLFRTIVILRLLPQWIHPLACIFLPSFWKGRGWLRQGKRTLKPTIEHLLLQDLKSTPDSFDPDKSDVLHWLTELARGSDRNPDTIAHIEILLALASVHTTLLRMVNVLYDITADGGDLVGQLRDEIRRVAANSSSWSTGNPYGELRKLDSVMRESQRMSPPTTVGMKRLFRQDHTFSNGLSLSAGTYACMPTFAIENDPVNTPDPERFDGLRYYRAALLPEDKPGAGGHIEADSREHLFSTPGKTALNFGYGKSACPGRFFASIIIKMLFYKLLTEYDVKFLPGQGRPSNIMLHEFLFCWPWQKMLISRRQNPRH
jgi:cytochrome P450